MNGFEDLEKKIQNLKRQTNAETDQQILENACAEFERSRKVRHSVYYIGPVVKTAAAVCILALTAGIAILLFNKTEKPQPIAKEPLQKIEQIVQPEEEKQIKIVEDKEQKESTDKLKSDLEKVAVLIQVKDTNGLLAILEDVELPAQMLAANYLGQFTNERIAEILDQLGQKHYPDEPNNLFELAADKIYADLDKLQLLDAEVLATEANEVKDANAPITAAIDSNKPQIVSINPPSGSEVALMFELEVIFDRPMNPNEFEINESNSVENFMQEVGAFYNYIEYDSLKNKFTIPIRLPHNWYGAITLNKFLSTEGNEIEPAVVNYHTAQIPFSDSLLKRFQQTGSSEELLLVLENVKKACSNITSLSETIYEENTDRLRKEQRSYMADFKKQGGRQFYTDISKIMETPFLIGSDGNVCWLYSGKGKDERLITAPYEDIDQKDIDICNPFEINDSNIANVIENYRLEYEGTDYFEGRSCHLIRSHRVQLQSMWTDCSISTWWFDAETFLPIRVFYDYGPDDIRILSIVYHSINEPLDISEFRYDSLTAMEPNLPEPRDENYNTRLIKVIDGIATGRMSVGWGMRGEKGNYRGCGLN